MRAVRLILTDDQCTALKAQSSRSGESMSAIVRRAVDAHLARLRPEGRLEALRGARGLWKGRRPPDLDSLRHPGRHEEPR